MLDIGIATITPALAACAMNAIRRTTTVPYRIHVESGPGTHAEKLDRIVQRLPPDAEWFFAMDDDAAPLSKCWYWELLYEVEQYDRYRFGHTSYVVGCLYRAKMLHDRSFVGDINPGDRLPFDTYTIPFTTNRPWWLRGCEVVRRKSQLVFAHLGGGTIGADWRKFRMPTRLWPWAVDWYLARQGL